MARRRLSDRDLGPSNPYATAIVTAAKEALGMLFPQPLGAERIVDIGGRQYACVLERHYHPPGGPAKPWGPHKGISMFEIVPDAEPASVVTRVAGAQKFVLGKMSLSRLQGVHPDLVRVVRRAIEITPIDFSVVEGLRTMERQRQLVAKGASQTLNSRHITGHAVDLAPYEGGTIHWDWPRFREMAPAILEAAKLEGVPVTWGGNWKSFPDGPHFELPRDKYPG